jgi:hypothetical protein
MCSCMREPPLDMDFLWNAYFVALIWNLSISI